MLLGGPEELEKLISSNIESTYIPFRTGKELAKEFGGGFLAYYRGHLRHTKYVWHGNTKEISTAYNEDDPYYESLSKLKKGFYNAGQGSAFILGGELFLVFNAIFSTSLLIRSKDGGGLKRPKLPKK